MTAAIFNKYSYLRIASGIILILLIGYKIVSPLVSHLRATIKVSALASQSTDNNAEKKAEINNYTEKEFVNSVDNQLDHKRFYTDIAHVTAYQNNYCSSHFSTITTPPPDCYLQPTV
ncbi:hypothetical protein [Mucilaginibacter glaciei]|uniref:Uncharacterized protein n=1 Tax=Mucilaginibacter glaciei TaxID=2772109 RepID=A0A926NPR0_9SPHI|nr:hypothetical protein [Mucilaginibacter glaciei]MBD1391635.1 hypothetical protein [Mucilaginibacter glaciei]